MILRLNLRLTPAQKRLINRSEPRRLFHRQRCDRIRRDSVRGTRPRLDRLFYREAEQQNARKDRPTRSSPFSTAKPGRRGARE
jgi:hypothetical protein